MEALYLKPQGLIPLPKTSSVWYSCAISQDTLLKIAIHTYLFMLFELLHMPERYFAPNQLLVITIGPKFTSYNYFFRSFKLSHLSTCSVTVLICSVIYTSILSNFFWRLSIPFTKVSCPKAISLFIFLLFRIARVSIYATFIESY